MLNIPTTSNTPSPPESTITYTVKRGDSLWSIANTYKTTVERLKELNNLTSDTLTIGQQLLIPTPEQSPTQNTYIVQKGDSLWLIANKFNTTVDELKSLNNLTSNILKVGQELKIPSSNRNTTPSKYTILKGDSLWLIAKKHNTTVTELINYNHLDNINLQPGDRLMIPNLETNQYIVQKGDSLWSIASAHNLSVTELKKLNNLTDNAVTIGQKLKIS